MRFHDSAFAVGKILSLIISVGASRIISRDSLSAFETCGPYSSNIENYIYNSHDKQILSPIRKIMSP